MPATIARIIASTGFTARRRRSRHVHRPPKAAPIDSARAMTAKNPMLRRASMTLPFPVDGATAVHAGQICDRPPEGARHVGMQRIDVPDFALVARGFVVHRMPLYPVDDHIFPESQAFGDNQGGRCSTARNDRRWPVLSPPPVDASRNLVRNIVSSVWRDGGKVERDMRTFTDALVDLIRAPAPTSDWQIDEARPA